MSKESSIDLTGVPEAYHDLKGVFSKSQADSLPPHCIYNCTIDLLAGTFPPQGRISSVLTPVSEAMENFWDSLAAGIIYSSSSLLGAGFLVEKKDGSLRPCIDYRGLNDIMVKNCYALSLMSLAFELSQGASFFTKLDLNNTYHLVHIREGDKWKTAFNSPTAHLKYLVMPLFIQCAGRLPGTCQ